MAECGSGFEPDQELSDLLSKLWELDTNKCYPGTDYSINLQGYVTSTRQMKDYAGGALFEWVEEEQIFEKPTYKAFKQLLDNYELECGVAETVTREERIENWQFLDAILETEVMKEAHQFLISRDLAPEDLEEFKKLLYKIWFKLVRRTRGDRDLDSSSFEHVFVGEAREEQFIGLHNWIQFFLQEKAGNIDYHGYFRRQTVRDDEVPRLIAMQFSWKGEKSKPMSSCFLGTSPEFEIAVYTLLHLLRRRGRTDCQLSEYEVEVEYYNFKDIIGTAFIGAARLH